MQFIQICCAINKYYDRDLGLVRFKRRTRSEVRDTFRRWETNEEEDQ